MHITYSIIIKAFDTTLSRYFNVILLHKSKINMSRIPNVNLRYWRK